MKNLLLLPALLLVIGFAQTLSAQNTFPANGAAGIGTATHSQTMLCWTGYCFNILSSEKIPGRL